MRARGLLPWLALAGLLSLLLLLGPWLAPLAGALYGLASRPFALLAEPLDGLRRNLALPEAGALLLGLLGALAPCQLSTYRKDLLLALPFALLTLLLAMGPMLLPLPFPEPLGAKPAFLIYGLLALGVPLLLAWFVVRVRRRP